MIVKGDRDVSGQVREAEFWGDLETIRDDRYVAVRAMHGTYGSLYEVEVRSAWILGRVHVIIATLIPPDLMHQPPVGTDGHGTFLIHFWREGRRNRDRHPTTQVSKPI